MVALDTLVASEVRSRGAISAAEVRALSGGYLSGKIHLLGIDSVGDGTGGWFVWEGASTAADDNRDTLKPDSLGTGSPGRWRRLREENDLSRLATLVEDYEYLVNKTPVPPKANLLLHSEAFDNAAWQKFSGATVTANTDAAPVGSGASGNLTDTLTMASGSTLRQSVSGLVQGATYTFSVWIAKSSTSDANLLVDVGDGTGGVLAPTTTMQRLSIDLVAGSQTWFDIFGQGTGNYKVFGAQLRLASFAASYVSTTSAQVVDHAEVVPQRGNYLKSSGTLNNAAWSAPSGGWTVTQGTDFVPVINLMLDTVTVTTANSRIRQNVSGLVLGATYNFSIWAGRGTGTGNLVVSCGDGATATIPLTSTVARYDVQVTTSSTVSPTELYFAFTATGTYKLGGIMLNPGTRVHDYIPTTGEQFFEYDWSPAVSAAQSQAALTTKKVLFPSRRMYLSQDHTIPPGVEWCGQGWMRDPALRGGVQELTGSVLVRRGKKIQMGMGSKVRGFTILYDKQKWKIEADGSKPDGLEDFLIFEPTFRFDGSVTLEEITYLGGTHFAAQTANFGNPEKFVMREIYGCPLIQGLRIDLCLDVVRISNVHWNLNSYQNLYFGNSTNYITKVAKNMDGFVMCRMDEVNFENCFIYGCRNWLWAKVSEVNTGDDGASWGASFVNCSADICHTVFRIERSLSSSFGIKIENGCFMPSVKNPIINGVASAETPAFIRFASPATNNVVLVSNSLIRCDAGVSNVIGSGATDVPFQFAAGTPNNNRVLVSNCHISGHTGTNTSGESTANNKTVNFGNCLIKGTLVNG